MAAPSPTARSTPGGLMLKEGFKTLITFARNPAIALQEVSVKPVGYDGGSKINLTSMHNTTVKTYATRTLVDVMDGSFKCLFDPAVLDTILETQLNYDDTITETFSDGSTRAYFGALTKFEVDEMTIDGDAPMATATIVALNLDSDGAEQLPVVTSVAGT